MPEIVANELRGNEDFTNALRTPEAIYGNDGVVFWRDCSQAIILEVNNDGKLGKIVKNMSTSGWCVLPRGYALYCLGDGGRLKKA